MGVVIILIILFIIAIIGLIHSIRADQLRKKEKANEFVEFLDKIDYIKVLGTRSAVNTQYQGNHNVHVNSTLYSLLIIFEDGSQMTREVSQDDMHYYDKFIRA